MIGICPKVVYSPANSFYCLVPAAEVVILRYMFQLIKQGQIIIISKDSDNYKQQK